MKLNKEINNKIQYSILNIDMICRSMFQSYQDTINLKIPLNSVVYGDMTRYSYIQFCLIFDEIETLNGLAKDDEYLKDTLYVISPAIKAMNKFSGIRKARNIMLAHFNRDKKGNFLPWWVALRDLKLPRTLKEVKQIYLWLQIVNTIIATRYRNELLEITNKVRDDVKSYFNWAVEQENFSIENPTLLDNVEEEVKIRIHELGIENLNIDPVIYGKLFK